MPFPMFKDFSRSSLLCGPCVSPEMASDPNYQALVYDRDKYKVAACAMACTIISALNPAVTGCGDCKACKGTFKTCKLVQRYIDGLSV